MVELCIEEQKTLFRKNYDRKSPASLVRITELTDLANLVTYYKVMGKDANIYGAYSVDDHTCKACRTIKNSQPQEA